MTQLLIDEPPLQVLPSLAKLIGLNEAIVLQQVHYWLQHSNNVKDGRNWIYNSYSEWHKQFPFWKSEATVRTTIKHLENMGLLITANYNKAGFDKTKWYSIDYEKLSSLKKCDASAKNWQTMRQKLVDGTAKNWQTNTNRLPETTTETNIYSRADAQPCPHSQDIQVIIDYLNEKTGKHFKSNSTKTKKLIKARFNEGFKLNDFRKVIDNKASEWLSDSKMNKFLRPETLFSNKFEGYLNEQPSSKATDIADEYGDLF